MSVAGKRKHASKKNKADWRKNCDIRDVEDFLEDQRLEERLGKFTTKPDSELFVIDTGCDADKPTEETTAKPLSVKQLKRAKLAATPKCFEILLPSSKVQDPNAKRNHKNPVGHLPTALSKITDKRRATKGVYQKKLEDARKNRKIAVEKRRKIKQIRQNFSNDLWDGDTPEYKGIPDSLVDDFISTEVQLHNVLPTKRLRAKPPLAKTVVTRAAVEAPHPGISYNPSFQEHQELLHQVVEHEEKQMKRERHLLRVTNGMFRKVTPQEMKEHQELLHQVVEHEEKQMKRERHLLRVTNGMFRKVTPQEMKNQWQEEMSIGLKPDNPAEQSDNETDDEIRSVNPPVVNKKKDHKTRRKQRERLVELEKRKREKINKKKISDIYTLRKIKTNIIKKEDVQAKERAARLEKRSAHEATALPKLSGHKTPKKEPDFVDPASLSGDLRSINTSTNLLRDRFESLQRRGALAASKLMMKKKRRVKSYFKPGHKVTDQDVDKYVQKVEKTR